MASRNTQTFSRFWMIRNVQLKRVPEHSYKTETLEHKAIQLVYLCPLLSATQVRNCNKIISKVIKSYMISKLL